MKTINQIEAFVDKVHPRDSVRPDFEIPQKISRRSVALFKTSKRRKHDRTLVEFESIIDFVSDEMKSLKDFREKLQSGVLFTQHEVMAHREQLKAVKAKLSKFFDKKEIEALDAALKASDESVGKLMTIDEEIPHQMMIKFRRGRFGLWKRYKQDKHSKIIAICACAVRDIVKSLGDTIGDNEEYICAINRGRDTLKSLRSVVMSANKEH